jgi:hypothetical protein
MFECRYRVTSPGHEALSPAMHRPASCHWLRPELLSLGAMDIMFSTVPQYPSHGQKS